MKNLMANKNFILYLFSTEGILSITFCEVDIIRCIKRCRPATEVFLRHRHTSDNKMVEKSCPQTEWAAWKGAKEKWDERPGQFKRGCVRNVFEAKSRGGVSMQRSRVSSDIVGLSAVSSFTQSCCSAPSYLDCVLPASHRLRIDRSYGKIHFSFLHSRWAWPEKGVRESTRGWYHQKGGLWWQFPPIPESFMALSAWILNFG